MRILGNSNSCVTDFTPPALSKLRFKFQNAAEFGSLLSGKLYAHIIEARNEFRSALPKEYKPCQLDFKNLITAWCSIKNELFMFPNTKKINRWKVKNEYER